MERGSKPNKKTGYFQFWKILNKLLAVVVGMDGMGSCLTGVV